MIQLRHQLASGIWGAVVLALHAQAAPAPPAEIIVRTDQPQQTIEGFGASGCWWAQEVGNWPEATRRELLKLLFSPAVGIGLTIYRHNLGAGSEQDAAIKAPLRRAESYLRPDGQLDWTRDAAATRLLREAVAAGAQQIVLFAISPPVSMTRNGRAYGDLRPKDQPATNLQTGRERDFARYLGDVTEHFVQVEHLPITALSPLNEPEWGWDAPKQEGCYYSPAEMVTLLKAVGVELRARSLPVRLEGPESGSWETARPYCQAIVADADLRAQLPVLCIHSYFSDARQKRVTRAFVDKEWPEARLRMTEWCEFRSGRDLGMDSALVLAHTVLEDLVIGRVSSWQYWLGATPHDYCDGLVQLDSAQRTIATTKRLWVLGQFSRFLRPGAQMVGVDSPWHEPRVVAALSPDRSRLVVVCGNLENLPLGLVVRFAADGKWELESAVATDARHDVAPLPFVAGAASLELPPRSVTTLVFARL